MSSSASRDKWPLKVLKKVLQQLQAEIPRQLLARELFCGAGSTAEWLQRQRAYASSTAVMSMVKAPFSQSSCHACRRESYDDQSSSRDALHTQWIPCNAARRLPRNGVRARGFNFSPFPADWVAAGAR